MRERLRRARAVVGGAALACALAAIAVGAILLVAGLATGHASVALGALASAWLYAAGLAAGGVALSAAVRLSNGRWAAGITPLAESLGAFLRPGLALLALLVFAAPAWIPGAAGEGTFAWTSRAVRDLLATAALVVAADRYVHRARASAATGRAAVIYLLLYAATLSLWAVDFVIALSDAAPSTVIPPFYFIGALLSGLAAATLLGALRPSSARSASTRHDLGKLLFAFAIFWGYLVWSAYLPVWYENLPDETGPLLVRWSGDYRALSVAVLLAVLGFPFVFLFPERVKRGRATLAVAASVMLGGLLGERVLLVLPSLARLGGGWSLPIGAGVVLGVLGLLTVTIGAELEGRY